MVVVVSFEVRLGFSLKLMVLLSFTYKSMPAVTVDDLSHVVCKIAGQQEIVKMLFFVICFQRNKTNFFTTISTIANQTKSTQPSKTKTPKTEPFPYIYYGLSFLFLFLCSMQAKRFRIRMSCPISFGLNAPRLIYVGLPY